MIELINSNPIFSAFFAFTLCAATYELGLWVNRKTGLVLLNPQLIAIALSIAVLAYFKISYAVFSSGAFLMNAFLTPITVVLAVPIYRQIHLLKTYALPILIGAGVGSITSMLTVYALCKAFGVHEMVYASLLAKSVTTPIGIEVSQQLGGIPSITIVAIIITGIFGNMVAPTLCRLFRIKNPVARGVAIGTSSHAMGTAAAIEMGEAEGAMSGLAIGIAGLITIILAIMIPW